MRYIRDLDTIGATDIDFAGGKAANLGELVTAGFPVPSGCVLTTDAYRAFVAANRLEERILKLAAAPPEESAEAAGSIAALFAAGLIPGEMARELREAYKGLGTGNGEGVPVAVRSSATAEDLAEASFAGQQETYLNVIGADDLLDAVRECWASLWTERAMSYRTRAGIAPQDVALAVVIQVMVDADAAGVMFTANPASGNRGEIVIGAAWGLGESVVGGLVSTDDLVVDAGTLKVLSSSVASKDTMTVNAGNRTGQTPVPEDLRNKAVLGTGEAQRLASLGLRIARHFGVPQDIEWARSGGVFRILQARPITALPDPEAAAPETWQLPYRHGLYFRASIVEQLPDPLTPLFADLIDPSVTASLGSLMSKAFGRNVMHKGDLGLPTVNGYAYYYYRASGFMRVFALSPIAVARLGRSQAGMGLDGWKNESHPAYRAAIEAWEQRDWKPLPGDELLAAAVELLDAGTRYYTAVQSVVPMAATSEIAFRAFYDKLVKAPGDPVADTFLLGFDSEPIRAEYSLYDLAAWARERPGLSARLLATDTSALAAEVLDPGARGDWPAPGSAPDPDRIEFLERFRTHLQRFGHAVYNLDFATPVPADAPAQLLDTLKFNLRGEGGNPHERQRNSAQRREENTARIMAHLEGRKARNFGRLLAWTQKAAPMREDALSDIGLAWPLLRSMLLELGERLKTAGVVGAAEDVFWLRLAELQAANGFGLADPAPAAGDGGPGPVRITGAPEPVRAGAVAERKALWKARRRADAPQMLPVARWADKALSGMMPAGLQTQTGDVIKGVGASLGTVRAPARVLAGPDDFASMQYGEVLVARMTTPAWTPLFAMAAAVVTDVGGPLSHSSIVAREYGIPAVLGTGVATRRIRTGDMVTVDGDAGTVALGDHRDAGN
ncbi:PEP/pyruvate-binding domain-containing protein [Paeniglutamicibacter kerguelensis]|uniref:Phosphoenolpyruvate synthase n=1 Tax=Paeniglutamicibacter kerguelensis TaxID=254788 RepID=A0ABS4XJC2_9MICC|nr:PEP/pyruvate-binding domain-containing protein [Paeniglutamicibacter kerguelensis]MBP2388562.1 pyruvate,water dikinase [Paeniglutamicibacter kerguelensis]